MREAWRRYPATLFFMGVTSVVFILTQLLYFGQATTARAILNVGGMLGAYVAYDPTQIWRLVSPIFVHIGWEHFFFNMVSLYFIGRMVEDLYGTKSFIWLYLLSGVMGNAFTLFFTPDVVAAGASTSLFGLFAAIAYLGYHVRQPYLNQLGRQYLTLIVINMVFSILSPDVSLAGHLGGAVGGVLFGVALPSSLLPQAFTKKQRLLAGLLASGLLLFLIGFGLKR